MSPIQREYGFLQTTNGFFPSILLEKPDWFPRRGPPRFPHFLHSQSDLECQYGNGYLRLSANIHAVLSPTKKRGLNFPQPLFFVLP